MKDDGMEMKEKSDPKTEDQEDYCERTCSTIDGDEVVCGSDGYMYTSEAQLECYSSCLHIGEFLFSRPTIGVVILMCPMAIEICKNHHIREKHSLV